MLDVRSSTCEWRPPLRPRPRRLWGLDVTLCIGALAQVPVPLAPCVVLGFDYQVSNDSWGSESEYKLHVLSDHLIALFAGSPGRAKELATIYQHDLGVTPITLRSAAKRLRAPFKALKRELAEHYVECRFGVSYRTFRKEGPRLCGSALEFARYLGNIAKHDMRVDLIIAGFIEGQAVLYQSKTDELHQPQLESITSFCAIGSGAD